jgi:site-specific DNA-methyltransferase (adenine-specific)
MGDLYLDKIAHGDCLELFKDVPDNYADMTFADPPFNLKKKYATCNDNLQALDYLGWCRKWLSEMVRVTKPSGSIFVHNIPRWLTYFAAYLNEIAHFKHWIAWDAPTMPMGKSLQPAHYGVLFFTKELKGAKIYELRYPHKRDRKYGHLCKDYGGKKNLLHPFGPLVSDVWTDIHRIKHSAKRDQHPCQLPIHLLERLILMTTDEGDIVLDPFAGTGTTAIAARRLGRKYIGFEMDADYVAIAENKLKTDYYHSKIGDYFASFYLGEVATLRDKDWDGLRPYFDAPSRPNAIEYQKARLKKYADAPSFSELADERVPKIMNSDNVGLFEASALAM